MTVYTINPTFGHSMTGMTDDLVVQEAPSEREDLIMQIHSGNYFSTLASTLESVLDSLPNGDAISREILERTIRDLTYLQKYYEII